jgi:ligand-binding SRPBCC domain-containing protein
MLTKLYILERKQIVSASLDKVFAFFENAENLARITPGWLNFQVKTPIPIVMTSGTEIEYTINWLGLPVRWKTRIAVYDPPNRFIDEQVSGPYATWIHLHTFEPVEEGVLMTDRVTYRLPFGPVGRLGHRLLVRKQLNHIFDYRRDVINNLFNGKQ